MTPKGGNKFDDTNNLCDIYCDAVYNSIISVQSRFCFLCLFFLLGLNNRSGGGCAGL
jgi:hypothetical protein